MSRNIVFNSSAKSGIDEDAYMEALVKTLRAHARDMERPLSYENKMKLARFQRIILDKTSDEHCSERAHNASRRASAS